MINHINLTDKNGQVYCCLRNRVVTFDDQHQTQFCKGCKMFNGFAGGRGVECRWDDIRETEAREVVVKDPMQEWVSNQTRSVATDLSDWTIGLAQQGANIILY